LIDKSCSGPLIALLNNKMKSERKKYLWLSLTPWAILAGLVVLAPIVFFLANKSIKEDKEDMTRLMVEKGAALIRSFEAGARTGMMGMGWGGAQLQQLLVETARHPLSRGNRQERIRSSR
jgi:two-component system sensor histidine kinase HydH